MENKKLGRPPGGPIRTPVAAMAIGVEVMAELKEFLRERDELGRGSWSIRDFISHAIREKLKKEKENG